jgi:hypothetical protein
MTVTLSIDDEVLEKARRHAEAMGTSVHQLFSEYLERLAGKDNAESDAAEYSRLTSVARGDSHGWKFNREEIHARK